MSAMTPEDAEPEQVQTEAEPSFWPSYAIDALPHYLWDCAGANDDCPVSLMPWSELERVVAANY